MGNWTDFNFTSSTQNASLEDVENTKGQEFDLVAACASLFAPQSTWETVIYFCLLIVSIVGIIGNSISAIVLSLRTMRSSTNILLLALSISDFVYNLINFLTFGLKTLFLRWDIYPNYIGITYNIIYPWLYPASTTAYTASMYLTVFVTLERFVVVYLPLRAHKYTTPRNSVLVTAFVTIISFIPGLPMWWFYESEIIYDYSTGDREMYCTLRFINLNVVYHPWYKVYDVVLPFVIAIGPILALSLLNTAIYMKIREANKRRRQMTQSESRDISLGRMLVCIVTITILCNSIWVVLTISERVFGVYLATNEISALNRLMFVVNASANFFVYTLMGKKFREALFKLFGEQRRIT